MVDSSSDLPNRLSLSHINRVVPETDLVQLLESRKELEAHNQLVELSKDKSLQLDDSALQYDQGFEDTMVLPGSPRIRLAFFIILNDPQLKTQTAYVQNKQKKNKLEKALGELQNKTKELRESKSGYLEELDSFLSFKKTATPETETSTWEQRIVSKLNEIGPELIAVEKQLEETTKQIDEL